VVAEFSVGLNLSISLPHILSFVLSLNLKSLCKPNGTSLSLERVQRGFGLLVQRPNGAEKFFCWKRTIKQV
jgi:hypothetical protein